MKSTIQRVLCAVALATLGAGAVGTAAAQTSASAPAATPPQHMHGGHFRRSGGSPFVGSLLRATRQLNLLPAQQASIKSILAGARGTHQPGTQPQGPDITVIGNPGSQGYAAAVQGAQAAAAARIVKESTVAEQIYAVLSKSQQDELPAVLASIQAKEQARRAQWASRHATGNG
jgi:hypothetical protein